MFVSLKGNNLKVKESSNYWMTKGKRLADTSHHSFESIQGQGIRTD